MIGIKANSNTNQVGVKKPFSKLAVGLKSQMPGPVLLHPSISSLNPDKGIINTFNNVDVVNAPITSKPPETKTNKYRIEKQRREKYKEPYV